MNLLDKAIGYISPKRACERASWRESLRGFYDSGGRDRLNLNWNATNASAEQADRSQRDIIRARARDLERNSDISESIVGSFERNVIGTGINLQAKILKDEDNEDEKLNKNIEELWKEWCKARNCDVTGQQSFNEMQTMAMRRLIIDGGIIFIKTYTKDGIVPFSLQAREVDDLDTSRNTLPSLKNKGNRIVGGIELNEYNKPVAYYLKTYSPDGFYTGQSERVEANRVIFLWKKTRPTQIREISPLAKTMPRIKEVNEFVEAISVKERILACLSVFITKQHPTGIGRATQIDKQSGYQMKTISPGMIHELQPGESVSAVNPSGQSSNAKDFIMMQQRLAGSGQGLSYETSSRDMSQVNYSSARQGLLEDQRTYSAWQNYIKDNLCDEVYSEFIISAVLCGELDIKDFWRNKRKYLRHEWITSGWSWIDPLKEVNANKSAIAEGMDTLANICCARGLDWKEVLKQRAKEQEYAKSLGINIGGITSGKEETQSGDTAKKNS